MLEGLLLAAGGIRYLWRGSIVAEGPLILVWDLLGVPLLREESIDSGSWKIYCCWVDLLLLGDLLFVGSLLLMAALNLVYCFPCYH